MLLSYRTADGGTAEYHLLALTRIGRANDNEIRLLDPSASSHHCELRMQNGVITVQDLGSTNGISVDGEPVQQAVLHHGNVLKVGDAEFLLRDENYRQPTLGEMPITIPARMQTTAADGFTGAVCRNHPNIPAEWRCSKCAATFCPQCIVDGRKFGVTGVKFCPLCSSKADSLKAQTAEKQRREKTFGAELITAWKYPFQDEGLVILIAGTIFLALTSIAQRFTFLLGGFVFVLSTGYLVAYSQKIITSTANGDDQPPTWPDFSDSWEDIVLPFFQAIGLFVFYLLPFFLSRWFLPEGELIQSLGSLALLLAALFLMPMAWLAVSMHDSIVGLSPHFVIPSILRIPLPYLAVFLELVLLVAVNIGVTWALDQVHVPILPWLLSSFFGLYFLMVISRVLGVLYYLNRKQLRWF